MSAREKASRVFEAIADGADGIAKEKLPVVEEKLAAEGLTLPPGELAREADWSFHLLDHDDFLDALGRLGCFELEPESPGPTDAQLLNTADRVTEFEEAAIMPSGVMQADKVFLKVQQRGGKKCVTIVEGLSAGYNLKAIARALERAMSCGAAVPQDGIIQLQGDQRTRVRDWLVAGKFVNADLIELRGAD